MSLRRIFDVLREIRLTSSFKEKEEIIDRFKSHKWFERTIMYALDPLKAYNMREIEYNPNSPRRNLEEAFDFLDHLSQKRGATDSDREHLSMLASYDEETVDVINYILNKDLKCGASIKTFQKFYPIINHNVMLCTDEFPKFLKAIDYDYSRIFWSLKLDGVRVWSLFDGDETTYISRGGKTYKNFKVFSEEIENIRKILQKVSGIKNAILDGEAISTDKNFQKMMSQVHRLIDVNPDIFQFYIFDFVSTSLPFNVRRTILEDTFEQHVSKRVFYLPHYSHLRFCTKHGTTMDSEQNIRDFVQRFCEETGDEGFVLKDRNSLYELKRSNAWCKIKTNFTYDVEVVGFEYGKKGSKYEKVVGKLLCIFNGKSFKCGTGLSDQERVDFLTNTPRMIEIDCKRFTNSGIPWHCSFIRVRDDK